jgi:hypothetical protein
VLNRIAAGMMLTEPEREHMFMLALGHPPEPRYREIEGSPRACSVCSIQWRSARR